jgi:hypothetical protein
LIFVPIIEPSPGLVSSLSPPLLLACLRVAVCQVERTVKEITGGTQSSR